MQIKILFLALLAFSIKVEAYPTDTAKVIIGFRYLIYMDISYGHNFEQSDSVIISYEKVDIKEFHILNKVPQENNWIFLRRLTDKIPWIKLSDQDSILALDNRKLFHCSYIVAYNKKTEMFYRLKGFRKNDFVDFKRAMKSDHIKMNELYVENLDLDCLLKCKKYSYKKCPCLISCEDRDTEIFKIKE